MAVVTSVIRFLVGVEDNLEGQHLFSHLITILVRGKSAFNIKCRVVAMSAPTRMRVSQKKKREKKRGSIRGWR